jgi:hypothetical protein
MSPARTRLRALTVLSAVVCVAASAAAQGGQGLSDSGKLDSAKTLYDAGKYTECVKQFDALIGHEPHQIHEPDVLERARIYYAACLIAVNKTPRADDQMRAAIRANPTMSPPDNLVFPQPVIERFIRVKGELIDEIRAAEQRDLERKQKEAAAAARRAAREKVRVEGLEKRASEEFVIQKNSRWLAAVPFGVGQFQNRDPALGFIFLSSEALLAGTALTSMVVQLQLNARGNESPKPDPGDINPKQNAWYTALLISSWGSLAVGTAGIAQAQIAYVPEFRETRHRELPPELRPPPENGVSLRAGAIPVPGGAGLGVLGRF